jgi:hypothetical protein
MIADCQPHRARYTLSLLLLFAVVALGTPGLAQTGVEPESSAPILRVDTGIDLDALLAAGDMASAVAELDTWCLQHPDDQLARYGLGWAQALWALESLRRDLHRHGANFDQVSWLAMLPVPYPAEPLENLPYQRDPVPTTYADVRRMLLNFVRDMSRAAATIEACDLGDDGLVVHPGRFAIGGPSPTGRQVLVVRWLGLLPGVTDARLEQLVVRFDQADVQWLAGYCHALAAPACLALAVDARDVFDHAGHLVFPRAVQPHAFLNDLDDGLWSGFEDAIAAFHVARLPVIAPEQMAAALTHLEAVLDHSDAMWSAIDGEQDDEHEWIPGPEQSGPLGTDLDAETVATWREGLAEVRRLLDGETLLPFWRGPEFGSRNVNLRRIFTEPTCLDPVLWMQGTAAAPYLQEGPVTPLADGQLWRRLEAAFGGHPAELAMWVN